jgi:hypothetical protein
MTGLVDDPNDSRWQEARFQGALRPDLFGGRGQSLRVKFHGARREEPKQAMNASGRAGLAAAAVNFGFNVTPTH